MPTTSTNGIQLHYETAGDGDPVLLIMGLGVRGDGWRFQHPALSRHHRVAWYDNRGVGQSDKPQGPYPLPVMARDALGLMDHLGFERAHVVGVSMGGMIAQHLALLAPERVRSLALVATSPGGRRHLLTGPSHLRDLLDAASKDPSRRLRAMERLLFPADFCAENRRFVDEILELDYGAPPPRHGRQGQVRGVLRHDLRPLLGEIEAPTLVVKPGRDRMIAPRAADVLARGLPNARLLHWEHAGHGVIRQCRDALSGALLEHFAAC